MEAANVASPVLLTASVQYILNVALTLPAILYLDRFGRRPALLIGSFLMMTDLFIVGALQASYGVPNKDELITLSNSDISWIIHNNSAVSKAIVALTYLFVCIFATTWGVSIKAHVLLDGLLGLLLFSDILANIHFQPTSWTYPSEIFPTKIRAKAVSLATASNWFFNCILAFAVPPLLWHMYFTQTHLNIKLC